MNYSEVFRYDSETGDLIWLNRNRSRCKTDSSFRVWNKNWAGKVAGSKSFGPSGPTAIIVCVHGKDIGAHRIIWEMQVGPIPAGYEIDHVNRDPFDNRLSNLRLATPSQNKMNRRAPHNSTGFPGVYWHRQSGTWCARVYVKRKANCMGYYKTPEEAHAAYVSGAKTLHGKFFNTDLIATKPC